MYSPLVRYVIVNIMIYYSHISRLNRRPKVPLISEKMKQYILIII